MVSKSTDLVKNCIFPGNEVLMMDNPAPSLMII